MSYTNLRSSWILLFQFIILFAHADKKLTLPPAPELNESEIKKSIEKAEDFLIKNQNADGSWGTAGNTKELNIYAPVPGAHRSFKTACTALSLMGLLDAGTSASNKAKEKGLDWIIEHLPKVKRGSITTIYNVWTHCYAIELLLKVKKKMKLSRSKRKAVDELIDLQINYLKKYETIHGGWAYYNFGATTLRPNATGNSFTTASILLALLEAKSASFKVDKKIIERGKKVLQRQLNGDFSYIYNGTWKWRRAYYVNRAGGSLSRTQVCNLALLKLGDKRITKKITMEWLDKLIVKNGWLDQGRKRPRPHESWFSVAGYYYYYGHYYASRNILELTKENQSKYKKHLAQIIISKQEKDGSFWDFPLYNYHKFYGTGLALITLSNCL